MSWFYKWTDGQGNLKTEACHVDGKHNRVTTMECPSESKASIGMFWTCLNDALRKLPHDNCQFKHHQYMFDEGGGFWASLKEQLGPDELTRAVNFTEDLQ